MADFKVGDRVHVSDGGGSYTTYNDFFSRNGLEYFKSDWARGVNTPEGDYTIAATGKHLDIREETLYLLRGDDRKIYISGNRYGYLTLIEEGGRTLKAYDLMKLAAENPEKYKGKKYRAVGPCCISINGKNYGEVVVNDNGHLEGKNFDNWAYINSHTKLEEIPQLIPFSEAVKAAIAGKKSVIELNGRKYTMAADKSIYDGKGYLLRFSGTFCTGMLDGMWTVEE